MATASPLLSRPLQAFVAVAEELHFGRAAQRLHMSQPPLSQQIRRFEAAVGAPLFVRNTRSVELTPAGRLLLERCRQLQVQAEAATRAAQRASRGEAGNLTLGFTHSTVYRVLPDLLAAFRAHSPEVELDLRQFTSDLLVEGVRTGRIDVALLRLSDSMRSPELADCVVATDPLVLVLPAQHALAAQKSVALKALHGLPFVGYAPDGARYFYELTEAVFGQAKVRPLVVQTSFLPTMLALVQAGMGAALVPHSVAVTQQQAGLAWRPLRGAGRSAQATLHCVWRRDNANPARAVFASVLSESLKPVQRSRARAAAAPRGKNSP